jgi:uncharacterized protein (UPF0276 family)
MLGIGFRREMKQWGFSGFPHQFIEVIPENWVRKDLSPLQEHNKSIAFHGISLNLGGTSPINKPFLGQVKDCMKVLDVTWYSDHLAASGDAHQLYDLFPIPFTQSEVERVAGRIKEVQDFLGFQIAIENSVYYTNVGHLSEIEFLNKVVEKADCKILLDVNNLVVNDKNHKTGIQVDEILWDRVNYVHIAGHVYSEQFDLYWDTHSQRPEERVIELAQLALEKNKPLLLEWDNQIPNEADYLKELLWLQSRFGITLEE